MEQNNRSRIKDFQSESLKKAKGEKKKQFYVYMQALCRSRPEYH